MKIVNETHWDTKSIAHLIRRVAQDELDPGQLKGARIKVEYKRRNGMTSGWCTYGTPSIPHVRMRLLLPRDGEIDLPKLAKTIAHELAHSRGLHHKDMKTNRYGWFPGWEERYAYAKGYPITAKPTPATPTREEKLTKKREAAVVKAQKMVKKWDTNVKRAATMAKKWRARLKVAEKRATASVSGGIMVVNV